MKPFCFVLMPFGTKIDDSGRRIDFDRIYQEIIRPACERADLDRIRADEETAGGFIHKPMFERLMLCDYVVADLTTANPKYKDKLRDARAAGEHAVAAVERELNVHDADPVIVIDLLLSYRAVRAWAAMDALVSKMSPVVAGTVMVREQHALALNRVGRRDKTQQILEALIDERGPSGETNGLLGRVHKDRWAEACTRGQHAAARGHLHKAIAAYLAGFESDWRDAFPGVNALTLMELDDPVDPRQAEFLPVVRYAIARRLASKGADYWDHASRLELSVLANDRDAARGALGDALAGVREKWEPESTGRNIGLIRATRERRQMDVARIAEIERELMAAAAG